MSYENYGDVNPLEHGGIWVKRESKNEYEILKNNPETNTLYDLLVDITDSWIEKDSVMSFIGMTEENFNPLQFAIGCTDYYSPENFGNTYKYETQNELIDMLFARGITENIEKYFLVSKTYEIISEESAENGDAEERGFEYQDDEMDTEDILKEINEGGFVELSSSWIEDHKESNKPNYTWIKTVDPVYNRDYIEKGLRCYYSLHIKCTQKEFYQICKLANLIK